MNRLLTILLAFLFGATLAQAEEEPHDSLAQAAEDEQRDSLEVSLLTCSPGDIAYTMYGHSAIRVHNITTGKDIVFNYGMFNLDEDNFVYKFVKGETDYVLGAEPADFFFGRYARKGESITEQVLNFTQAECWRIFEYISINIRPENRTYRYNWLYDNCTTRARDMIERAVDGTIDYWPSGQEEASMQSDIIYGDGTARNLLHHFAKANRWVEFGQNMVLGYELDTVLTRHQQNFLPSFYAETLGKAVIICSPADSVSDKKGEAAMRIPLVRETREMRIHSDRVGQSVDEPLICSIALLLIVIAVSIVELHRRKTFKWLDVMLSLVVGTMGLLISFLFFFSQHAGVDSNMLIILFNPIAFAFIPFIIKRQTKIVSYVIVAEFAAFILTLFVLPQRYDVAFWPLASTLLLRLVVNIWLSKQKSVPLYTNRSIK